MLQQNEAITNSAATFNLCASPVRLSILRLLEEEESKVIALKKAIQEGIDSGIAHDFDPKKHLESLKAKKHSNG